MNGLRLPLPRVTENAYGDPRTGTVANVFLPPKPGESVDGFLARLTPSKTDISRGHWIYYPCPTLQKDPEAEAGAVDMGLAVALCHSLLESRIPKRSSKGSGSEANRPVLRDIVTLASENGISTGKWLLFPNLRDVDAQWAAVVRLTAQGKLGDAAKVSTRAGGDGPAVMCVYVSGFVGEEGKRRVRSVWWTLRDAGLYSKSFKPDILTHLGINSQNHFALPVSLYTPSDAEAWGRPGGARGAANPSAVPPVSTPVSSPSSAFSRSQPHSVAADAGEESDTDPGEDVGRRATAGGSQAKKEPEVIEIPSDSDTDPGDGPSPPPRQEQNTRDAGPPAPPAPDTDSDTDDGMDVDAEPAVAPAARHSASRPPNGMRHDRSPGPTPASSAPGETDRKTTRALGMGPDRGQGRWVAVIGYGSESGSDAEADDEGDAW